MLEIKFRELREKLSTLDRISICNKETMQYKNFLTIKDVPTIYDDSTVYGIGVIESEFYKINDFEYSTKGKRENLVLLSCIEIVVIPNEKAQVNTNYDTISVGSVVEEVGKNCIGIVKEIKTDSEIIVDIYYQEDNYLIEPSQKNITFNEIKIADNNDFRAGYLKYLSKREYLHIYSKRDKERMSAVLHQIRRAWETFPDLRLGQLIANCGSNYNVIFNIEDEQLMDRLQKIFIESEVK